MKFYIITFASLFLALSACHPESNPADLQSGQVETQQLEKAAQNTAQVSHPKPAQQLVETQLLPAFRNSLSDQTKTWHRGTQNLLQSLQCSETKEKQNQNNQDQDRCHPPKNRELLAASEKPIS